jgi:hypothetical protein
MRAFAFLTAVLLFMPSSARCEDKIDLKAMKYDGLAETINGLKGKVVVVDFWADF